MGAGMWATIGILATLIDRARTKQGGCISTSLYETALAWLTLPMASYGASGETRRPYGSGVAEIVPYQCFPTRDGWLMIAAGNDGLYRKLCAALNHLEWATDERFRENAGRVAHRDILLPMIESATRDAGMAELTARLDALGIPNAPLQDVAQVAAHEQTQALGILQAREEDGLRMVGLPVSFDGVRPDMQWPVPRLGEHNDILDKAK
jgi:crotonobetainyl-CoA:carnitine CoA-transferase CaiB-like acyl-CoA transferase